MANDVRYSPLALSQLDYIWDDGFQRFGVKQANKYLDGLFDLVDEIAKTWTCNRITTRVFPIDMIADITSESIYFSRYENEVVYLKNLQNEGIGVISILGVRMDTPNRLKEMLDNPLSII
tara:strand:- start:23598 stop:23957 length:360 start_codon:yes stop_codon:yes gene_type:complete